MPYILKERRDKFDPHIEPLVEELFLQFCDDRQFTRNPKFKGNLNYVFTKISKDFMRKCELVEKFGYQEISDVEGALQGATHEWRRRVLDIYENEKIIENGDL